MPRGKHNQSFSLSSFVGVVARVEQLNYQVEEPDAFVEVCVRIAGANLDRPVTVTVSTQETGSAEGVLAIAHSCCCHVEGAKTVQF